ncbi:hypothetical protein MHM93_14250 [Pseudoalteromonas sp. MM17-2]|uniref:hypothetical protein n=1 Tax=Pseudoalteromonas sp. MM17-2 TaxID=2917753 RepID=UPI001EF64A4F|nr:hypothetical protein [Pseudoalteromonas sp. MM17-2]MCG7545338.1 hypothetical protein [Pseudoalteromonas sp. MM17-2]
MKRIFDLALVVQLILVVGFVWFGWQADQAMDKSGTGNYEEWSRLTGITGVAFLSAAGMWVAVVVLALFQRMFSSLEAQLAVGLPPLFLVLGWISTWVV